MSGGPATAVPGTRVPAPRAAEARRRDLLVVALWLAHRVWVLLFGALALTVVPMPTSPGELRMTAQLTGYDEFVRWLAAPRGPSFYWVEPLWRWDALAYLGIARDGYSAGANTSTVFPPLYPLLVRLAELALPGQWVPAGLLVSALAAAAATVLLGRLARLEFGRRADLAPLFLLAAPTAFYLAAPYAEGLFLVLSIGALLAARRGHWGWSALLALALGFTKSHAPALIVPLAILGWPRLRAGGPPRGVVALAVLAPLAGPLALELYSRFWLGDLGPLQQQTARWGWTLVVPGWTIVEALLRLARWQVTALADLFDPPLLLLGLAWLAWGWRRLPPYLAWYGLAVLLPGLSRLMEPPLAANIRFLLLSFPIPLAIALWADRPWRRVVLLSLALPAQAALLFLFVQWTWVA